LSVLWMSSNWTHRIVNKYIQYRYWISINHKYVYLKSKQFMSLNFFKCYTGSQWKHFLSTKKHSQIFFFRRSFISSLLSLTISTVIHFEWLYRWWSTLLICYALSEILLKFYFEFCVKNAYKSSTFTRSARSLHCVIILYYNNVVKWYLWKTVLFTCVVSQKENKK